MEISNTMTVEAVYKPKHKWLTKCSKFAKKATLFATTFGVMAPSFISTACTVLKSVICLIGGGVGVWGIVNLLEGYGNDNPGAKSQGMKQLMAGLGLILFAIVLVPVLQNMMTGAV